MSLFQTEQHVYKAFPIVEKNENKMYWTHTQTQDILVTHSVSKNYYGSTLNRVQAFYSGLLFDRLALLLIFV